MDCSIHHPKLHGGFITFAYKSMSSMLSFNLLSRSNTFVTMDFIDEFAQIAWVKVVELNRFPV